MTGLKRYIFTVIEQCRVLGYVSTIAGRRRYLPNISSTTNRAGRAQAERQAVNTTVQGSAADLVKVATINIQQQLPCGKCCPYTLMYSMFPTHFIVLFQ